MPKQKLNVSLSLFILLTFTRCLKQLEVSNELLPRGLKWSEQRELDMIINIIITNGHRMISTKTFDSLINKSAYCLPDMISLGEERYLILGMSSILKVTLSLSRFVMPTYCDYNKP